MPRYHIVNTDNFGSDWPGEKFVENLPLLMDKGRAEALCEAINDSQPDPMSAPRFFKVVEDGYVLQPGFEP